MEAKLTKKEQAALDFIQNEIANNGHCALWEPRTGVAHWHLGKAASGATIKKMIQKGILQMGTYAAAGTKPESLPYVGKRRFVLPTDQVFPQSLTKDNEAYILVG